MRYFSLPSLNQSIRRIREGSITHEHHTGTAAFGLCEHYFPIIKYIKTPEQIQGFTNKRPDITIERYLPEKDSFTYHCFVELKSLVNSDFDAITNQLFSAIVVTVDDKPLLIKEIRVLELVDRANLSFADQSS